MDNEITSEEVILQFTRAIKVLLQWEEQRISKQFLGKASTEEIKGVENKVPSYLHIQDAAEMLNISRSQLYKMVKRGDIPIVRFGQAIRIKKNDLEKYITENRG